MSEDKRYGAGPAELKRRQEVQLDVFNEDRTAPGEPEVCKWFGCWKSLTIQEKLFGQYCIHHHLQNSKIERE